MSEIPPVEPEESSPEDTSDLVEHSRRDDAPDQFEADHFDDLPEDWDSEEGEDEYAEANDSEVRLHVPRPLVWGLASVLAVVCIIGSLVTFASGSWSPGGDQPVNLGPCLNPIRAALTAAGAPQTAVQRLTAAAQPDIFDSDALPLLLDARRLLEPMQDNPMVASALQVLAGMTTIHSQNERIHCP